MDWSKLKMNELKYYCTSFDIDFDCLPVSDQIRYLIGAFYHYDITAFEIADIKEFYQTMQLRNPRSGKVVKPTTAIIRNAVRKINTVQCTSENCYKILSDSAETQYYSARIKQAYINNRLS